MGRVICSPVVRHIPHRVPTRQEKNSRPACPAGRLPPHTPTADRKPANSRPDHRRPTRLVGKCPTPPTRRPRRPNPADARRRSGRAANHRPPAAGRLSKTCQSFFRIILDIYHRKYYNSRCRQRPPPNRPTNPRKRLQLIVTVADDLNRRTRDRKADNIKKEG